MPQATETKKRIQTQGLAFFLKKIQSTRVGHRQEDSLRKGEGKKKKESPEREHRSVLYQTVDMAG
jgi:hypothetical protein